MMGRREVLVGLLSCAGLTWGFASSAVAGPLPDATSYHRVNLEAMADRLLSGDHPYLKQGEKVAVVEATRFEELSEVEGKALRHLLWASLGRRGIAFTARETEADVLLELMVLGTKDASFFSRELTGLRPGPAYRLRDRVVVRVTERASGRLRGEDYLVAEFKPFDGSVPEVSADASASGGLAVDTFAAVQQELTGYGLSVSWLSGSGFAFRRWLANGWGWQVAGIPYSDGVSYFHNAGGQVMRQLIEGGQGRLYMLGATGAAYGNMATTGWYRRSEDGQSVELLPTLLWNLSAGLGADLRLTPNFVLAFGAGYSLGPQATVSPDGRVRTESLGITPGFSIGTFLEF